MRWLLPVAAFLAPSAVLAEDYAAPELVWHTEDRCPGSGWKRWAYHGLNIADKAITHRITTRGNAVEANPLWTPVFGKRISAPEAGAMTAVFSLVYEVAFRALRKDCRSLSYFQGAALIVQGGVVGANLRFVF